jgi:hypothetical protein
MLVDMAMAASQNGACNYECTTEQLCCAMKSFKVFVFHALNKIDLVMKGMPI